MDLCSKNGTSHQSNKTVQCVQTALIWVYVVVRLNTLLRFWGKCDYPVCIFRVMLYLPSNMNNTG